MKYLLFTAALFTLNACSKSKDNALTLTGKISAYSYRGNVSRQLLAYKVPGSSTGTNVPVYADFTTDTLGNFRIGIDASLAGDSIYLTGKNETPPTFTPIIRIPKGISNFNTGTLLLDTL